MSTNNYDNKFSVNNGFITYADNANFKLSLKSFKPELAQYVTDQRAISTVNGEAVTRCYTFTNDGAKHIVGPKHMAALERLVEKMQTPAQTAGPSKFNPAFYSPAREPELRQLFDSINWEIFPLRSGDSGYTKKCKDIRVSIMPSSTSEGEFYVSVERSALRGNYSSFEDSKEPAFEAFLKRWMLNGLI